MTAANAPRSQGHAAFVAIGSNIEPQAHLVCAASALKQDFSEVQFSSCYRNPAFGFEGADFLNAVAAFRTELSIDSLVRALREIETRCGRGASDPKWGPRAIDLDLLLYDQVVAAGERYTLPRPDLTCRAYMLGPLAELAPRWPYPPDGPTVGELWAQFPRGEAPLQRTELDLNALPP